MKIKEELTNILEKNGKNKILDFYKKLEGLLDKKGASKETANRIYNYHLESNS